MPVFCSREKSLAFSSNVKVIKKISNKVISLSEACFHLISSSSLQMKIQIMGRKITENLGFKSPLQKVKKYKIFKITRYSKMVKNKDMQSFMENFKF